MRWLHEEQELRLNFRGLVQDKLLSQASLYKFCFVHSS